MFRPVATYSDWSFDAAAPIAERGRRSRVGRPLLLHGIDPNGLSSMRRTRTRSGPT